MQPIRLVALFSTLAFVSSYVLSTEDGYFSSEEPKPTPPPIPQLFIDGRVLKDYRYTTFQEECADRQSPRCSTFGQTLCETMLTALNTNPHTMDTFGGCGVYGPNGNNVIATLDLKTGHEPSVSIDAVKSAIVQSYMYAKSGWSYFGSYFDIKAVGISDSGPIIPDTTEKNTYEPSTEEPKPTLPPAPKMVITGRVMKDYAYTTFQEECENVHSTRCQRFFDGLCKTMVAAVKARPEIAHMFSGCAIEGPSGNEVIASMDHVPGYPTTVSFDAFKDALAQSYSFAQSGDAYYGYTFTLNGVGLTDSGPITPGPTEDSTNDASTEEPKPTSPPTPKMVITGRVLKDYAYTTYQAECADFFSGRCNQFLTSLCRTMLEAVRARKEVGDLISGCAVEGSNGDEVTSSLDLKIGVSPEISFDELKNALVQSYAFAHKGDSYYGSYFTLKGVGIIDSGPITPGPTEGVLLYFADICDPREPLDQGNQGIGNP